MQKQIPLFKTFLSDESISEALSTFEDNLDEESKVELLESTFKKYFNVPYILITESDVDALSMAFSIAYNNDRDLVATTPISNSSIAQATANAKSSYELVDVDIETCNISTKSLDNKLTGRINAVNVTHFGGYPANLNKIQFMLTRHKAKYGYKPLLIEDCSYGLGSLYNDKMLGTIGDIGILGIEPVFASNLSVMVFSNEELFEKAKNLRSTKPQVENFSICRRNFKWVNKLTAIQQENAERLRSTLSDTPGVQLMKIEKNAQPACWYFIILAEDHDNLQRKLEESGVDSWYPPKTRSILGNFNYVKSRILCVPCGWWCSDEIDHIANTIKSGW